MRAWRVVAGLRVWTKRFVVELVVWSMVARRRFQAAWYVLKTGFPPPKDL